MSPEHRELIINGRNIPKRRYPYYVSLDYHRPTEKVVLSGVLIAPDVVLTAGHCLPKDYEYVTARIGTYSLANDTHIEEYDVVESIRHPMWAETTKIGGGFTHDFSLFRLNETALNPVLAHINRDDSVPPDDSTLQVLGLGWTNAQQVSPADIVQMSDLTPIPNSVCGNISDTSRNLSYQDTIDDTMICFWAGPDNSHDSCGWDSGGAVVYNKHGGVDGDYRDDLIVGLVSWGVDGCADPVFPSVYARVSAGAEWITETLCDLSTEPPASFKCPKKRKTTKRPTMAPSITTQAPTAAPILTLPPTMPPVVTIKTKPPAPAIMHDKQHPPTMHLSWPIQLLAVLAVVISLLVWHYRRNASRERNETGDSEQELLAQADYGSMEAQVQAST